MKAGTLPHPTSMMLVVGFFVLASVLTDVRPALAQTQEACPLPADVAPPAAPAVTAQQVEDGSASLKDFALAARDGLNLKQEQGLYFYNTCLLREEGGPYRSGSTYLVQLTPDGRILIHAKDMALAPGQLNPLIYAEILSALGVPSTVLGNLASTDPAVAGEALATLFATLSQELDAPFDAGLPGASGYATSYFSESIEAPVLLLAGFDLNESHLAEEEIDYGNPAITASDVVDRETLKAFVKEAEAYFAASLAAGGIPALSKVRLALRDENGPWRHGSVYLYLLDLISNTVVFHGAFPDRFELRPLVGIARDGVTGELILPQVLEAAKSNPEGGFVEYFYDDPDDDTDRADIPKVGYARMWLNSVVIGSGFYRSSADDVSTGPRTEVEATVLGDAVEGLTVEFSRAIAGHQPNYLWSALTDATGHVSLTISSARRVSGYYQARARNAAGETVGQWHSIPLNRDRRRVLELTLGGGMSIVRVEPLAAAKTVAATSGLAPNVPNPFNSATQIAYHLSSPGPVQLVIYNVLGQPVRTLVNQFQAAGSYHVQWDARDQRGVSLSSGIYITRLSYPGGVQTQRLLYLK